MKPIASLLLLFALCSAFQCQHPEAVEPNPENQSLMENRPAPLVGKWQLVETYLSAGGPMYPVKADPNNPSIIEFRANGEYVGGREDCAGRYTVASDQKITIKSSCSTGQVRESELSGVILPSGELSIVPVNPACIEGCSHRYKPVR